MDDDVVPGLGGLLVRGSSAWTARGEDAHELSRITATDQAVALFPQAAYRLSPYTGTNNDQPTILLDAINDATLWP
ncbi:hypothetical protein NL676_012575 [Syzygium grande]|nr:hypothetical protein NL676_012575 [Syzygium grande]